MVCRGLSKLAVGYHLLSNNFGYKVYYSGVRPFQFWVYWGKLSGLLVYHSTPGRSCVMISVEELKLAAIDMSVYLM